MIFADGTVRETQNWYFVNYYLFHADYVLHVLLNIAFLSFSYFKKFNLGNTHGSFLHSENVQNSFLLFEFISFVDMFFISLVLLILFDRFFFNFTLDLFIYVYSLVLNRKIYVLVYELFGTLAEIFKRFELNNKLKY